jgi:hypothetical protein
MPDGTKLSEFTAWCAKHITGDEKGDAQLFLDRLFQAFGHAGLKEAGATLEFRVTKAAEAGGGTAFADLVWKPVVLIEMKKRGTDLQKHYRQAFDYWTRLVPNRPRYVVLCNFDEFRVYDFDTDLDTPKDTLALKDLPERWGPLAFLAPGSPKPTFDNDREVVTRLAADCLADCFRKLVKRDVPQPMAQRFILQMLVALFAEDIDLLPKYFVTQILEDCSTPASTYDLIGDLFEAMNTNPPKAGGRFKGVNYFNGGLFAQPARLEIQDSELVLLRKAAGFNWSKVQPEVFGTLFQHSMDARERHAFGAQFTMMIARKLAIDELHITEPALPFGNLDKNFIAADALLTPDGLPAQWPKADVIIGNPPFLGAKLLKPERGPDYVNTLRRAYSEVPGMADYCVYWIRKAADHLPACTAADPVAGRAGLVGTQNIRNNQSRVGGLDYVVKTGTIVEAVESQPWSGEANVHVSIANWVKTQDAALLPKTRKLWFKVEPSAAAKKLRKRGSGPATKDYELDVRETVSISPALSDQTDVTAAARLVCNCEPQVSFSGQVAGYEGFVLTSKDAADIIHRDSKSAEVIHPFLIGRDLVTGNGQPSRFVIDLCGQDILSAQSFRAAFEHLEVHVLPYVQTKAETGVSHDAGRKGHLEKWWEMWRPRPLMIRTLRSLPRYIVCSDTTKRPIFAFVSNEIWPDHKVRVFAFADDYSFGLLQSHAHWLWFVTKCSKLAERFNYTSESVFDTFPWPQFDVSPSAARRDIIVEPSAKKRPSSVGATSSEYAAPDGAKTKSTTASYKDSAPDGAALSKQTIAKIDAVAAAARELRRVRAEAMPKMKGGLRALYRTLELPGANPLKDAHAALDTAVLTAYGFNPKRDLLAQLLALNQEVAAKIENAESVTAPGVPKNYPDASKLVTVDCIQP